MASDEELMLSAAAGDMEAFGELVLRHQDRAWRTAYHYVGNRADAEDLAQEAFLRILDAAATYKERDRAIHGALDYLPDRQRIAVVLRYFEELSLSEIAESMDTSYKAVEHLLARARASLESHLRGFLEE